MQTSLEASTSQVRALFGFCRPGGAVPVYCNQIWFIVQKGLVYKVPFMLWASFYTTYIIALSISSRTEAT